MLCHPLVSPLSAKSWAGSPPIYIGTGTELLTDEDKCLAQAAARHGVAVIFEEYQAMPHCFAMVLEALPASRLFFKRWSDFMTLVVERNVPLETKGVCIKPKTLQEVSLDLNNLMSFTEDEIRSRMRARVKELSEKNPEPLSKL